VLRLVDFKVCVGSLDEDFPSLFSLKYLMRVIKYTGVFRDV
jgi:hypothetical protein